MHVQSSVITQSWSERRTEREDSTAERGELQVSAASEELNFFPQEIKKKKEIHAYLTNFAVTTC